MLRIALCDDEAVILDEVSSYIDKFAKTTSPGQFEVSRFLTAKSLLGALEDGNHFDIFILDVYIGDEMGTTLAKQIRKRGIECPIMFLTTSVEHAPESFETGTLRYLIKPLTPQKFFEAMGVAVQTAEKARERQVKLKTENGIESINANRIMCTESHAHYQFVTLEDGNRLRVRLTVAELFETLIKHGGFVRVGSAYIINLRKIKNVTTAQVRLYNNISIPIPRGKHTDIKKAFWDFQCEGQEG